MGFIQGFHTRLRMRLVFPQIRESEVYRYLPFTVVLWMGPCPVLVIRHWPVTACVAGPTDVLHLPFLLHGLTDASNVARKLRVGANCAWGG